MTSFFLTLLRFMRAFIKAMRDEEFRAIFILVATLLLTGTIFYSRVEGWSVLDSLYFSVITLTTVGYGDLHPTTPFSKLFTIIYILIGIGALVAFASKLTKHAVKHQDQQHDRTSASKGSGEQEPNAAPGAKQEASGD